METPPEITGEMMTPEEVREVRNSQEDLDERVRAVQEAIVGASKAAIEEDHWSRPIVAAIRGGTSDEVDYMYPYYSSDDEKVEAFARINKHVSDTDAYGVVAALPVSWVGPDHWDEDADIAPVDHPDSVPALMVIVRSRAWSEMTVHTFSVDPDGTVEWTDTVGPTEDFEEYLIHDLGS